MLCDRLLILGQDHAGYGALSKMLKLRQKSGFFANSAALPRLKCVAAPYLTFVRLHLSRLLLFHQHYR
jgi:hypothetical protein